MKTAIHWFRRDLRLTDNTSLAAAAKSAESVVPVYIRSTWTGSHRWTGPHRQEFLCGSLASLDGNLRSLGSRLLARRGDAVAELLRLAHETKAEAIFYNRDPDPSGRATERRLDKVARQLGIEVHAFKDVCIHEREEILTGKGDPFRVFTPYAKAWLKVAKPQSGGRLRALRTPGGLFSEALPGLEDWKLKRAGEIVEPGERAARARFTLFLNGPVETYGETRNTPAEESTSRLGQDLRYGLLSIREVFERCRAKAAGLPAAARKSAHAWINELIWREFYMQVLWHCPEVLEHEFNPKFRGMRWLGDERNFTRWKQGETGFPMVDAAMRQLAQTGFMHNRARMIVAMFLTKDLQLDWRLGESWFMQQLTDGEIASNNGGWQWSAGTGADAAPYFRIQNPWTQMARYDADGGYIKQWIPELRDVPAERLSRPPENGCALVKGYPAPIVDHAVAREKTLEMFRQASG